jgi:osmoprotectant transport system ATP-binding protein
MSELTINGVSKSYNQHRAICDITIAFTSNKITAVIGRSGCGKSTLLKLLNGLERPDAGHVSVFGHNIDYCALAALRKKIGYAVQGIGLFPHLTVQQNIELLARLSHWEAAIMEQRVEQLLALMQLNQNQLGRYPHELSGGQQQRVGLCRAMMLNPPVLLLDEAFAALDPLTRSEIHSQLLQLHKAEPRTVVLVTHDMHEALTLADEIVIMEAGAITLHQTKDVLVSECSEHDPNALLLSLMSQESADHV